jgi:hypothetical protein
MSKERCDLRLGHNLTKKGFMMMGCLIEYKDIRH